MGRAAVILALLLAACGDNDLGAPSDAAASDAAPDARPDILAALNALAGVHALEVMPMRTEPGYRYFDLTFTQPIDHEHPEAGAFEQRAALMHRAEDAPLILYVGGYDLSWGRDLTEPAGLVEGNQLSLEYRFYGESMPATIDWSKLTVGQALADEHAILGLLGTIYTGAKIQTGGSKGGENAMAHMQAYPGDLDGAVAYVAPVITALPDTRWVGYLDQIGITNCTQALRNLAREMLVRRSALEPLVGHTDVGITYTKATLDHAYETAVVELVFSFWMTRGEPDCSAVPATTATDNAIALFLDETNPPYGYSDQTYFFSLEQYTYQTQAELGYPVWDHANLDDLMQFSYEDWSAYMPAGTAPTYAPTQPVALAAYLAASATHIMHIGGQWDPWGGGYPTIAGTDSFDYSVSHGSHWSSGIYSLAPVDRDAALATLKRWARVPMMRSAIQRAPLPELDPALRRADERRVH